jgi:hypothetical protein
LHCFKTKLYGTLIPGNHLTPLDAGELREAIEKPAELVGLKFEEGLIDKLINDVLGEPAALPLLQFTLLKLWEHRERNRITQQAYKKLGGGRRALSNSADEFYNKLIPEDQVTCKRIFLKMVRPTEGLEVTSSRIPLKELDQIGEASDRVERVLKKLIEARLVRQTEGNITNDTQVEVAHEALIRNWHQLMEWLEDERDSLRQRLRLRIAAEQWQEQKRDKSFLLRGIGLEEALRYKDLNQTEIEFVKRSSQQKTNNLRALIGSVMAVILALSGLNGYALVQQREALNNQKKAEAYQREANKQAVIALNNQKKAEAYQREANKQAVIALKNQKEAEAYQKLSEERIKQLQEQVRLLKQRCSP